MQEDKDAARIRPIFEAFGPLDEVHLPTNRATKKTKGFAFVEFKHSADADRSCT